MFLFYHLKYNEHFCDPICLSILTPSCYNGRLELLNTNKMYCTASVNVVNSTLPFLNDVMIELNSTIMFKVVDLLKGMFKL